jgi:hypothetical protein
VKNRKIAAKCWVCKHLGSGALRAAAVVRVIGMGGPSCLVGPVVGSAPA